MSGSLRVSRLFLCFLVVFTMASPAKADSQEACAIWLCLPGGFPSGCSGAYHEFKHRIKKGKPPLPDLASCSTGPNDERMQGRYELGYEPWVPCEDGYILREARQENRRSYEAFCFQEVCAPDRYSRSEEYSCGGYKAVQREKPDFVKMWVNGDYMGQYFYQ